MSRRPASFTQADVARVIRAAKQAGACEVVVQTGETSIVVRLEQSTDMKFDTQTGEVIVL